MKIYYFSEKKEVDFIVKEGLEVTAAINVCYDISDRETYLRELSGLHEAMNYFGLREALLISAEAQPQEITERGLKIKIVPFLSMGLGGLKGPGYPRLTPCRGRLVKSGMTLSFSRVGTTLMVL